VAGKKALGDCRGSRRDRDGGQVSLLWIGVLSDEPECLRVVIFI
jgi:hypothetical protein